MVGKWIVVTSLFASTPVFAQATANVASARELLKRGYAAKQENRCAEAIPMFEESARLDPTTKAYMNLADCQERVGRLSASLQTWVIVRTRAKQEGLDPVVGEADSHMVAVEARLPKLTIRLEPTAPPSSEILRDGTVLGRVSYGLALPVEPGKHTILVRAPGYRETTREVTLIEGEKKDVSVAPGEALPPGTPTPLPQGQGAVPQGGNPNSQAPQSGGNIYVPPPAPANGTSEERQHSSLAIGLMVGGGAALTTSLILGFVAKGIYNDSLTGGCNINGQADSCNQKGLDTRDDARLVGNLGTAAFIGGLIAGGAGFVLFVLPNKGKGGTALRSSVVPQGGSLILEGKF